jgi:DNA-directed RNA polymerase II subunit RPB2
MNEYKYTKYLGGIINGMTTTQPNIITLDDDEKIIEPGFVNPEDLTRIIQQGVFPSPFKVEEEEVDETNRDLPGALVLSPSGQLLKQYITWEGFGDHHIQVFDNWISRSAYNNVYNRMLQFADGRTICFENLKIFHPRYTRDGKVLPLTPKLAREQGVTYGGDWHVDVVLRKGGCGGEELDRRTGVCIGTVPTMLKSHNCILHGKTPRELALLGEDPKDPGGYFIVSGTEKVVLLQEQLAVNKIFLMNMDSKGSTVARMTANTVRGTALIELALDKKTRSIIKIRFPSMRGAKQGEKYKSINVLRIFRIFGKGDPTDIQNIISLFMKPEHVKKSMFKLTRNLVDFMMFPDDIEIMATKMDKSKLSQDEKVKEVLRVFETDLFPHLNNLPGPDNETVQERENRIATAKVFLLSIMIARFLEHLAGFRALDNRDSWSNKRVEGAGRMMEQLFRNAWRKTLGIVQASIETGAIKDLGGVVEKIRYSVITDTFHDSFITSNWGVKGTQMKNNVAQTLVRDSVVATFAHINTVDVGISRTDRQQSLRMVQNDQWGFICPASTPEGENAGILKNLSITAKVSLERSDSEIIRLLIGDQAKGIVQRVAMDPVVRTQWPDKMIVNGKFLGWCNAEETRNFLVDLRRNGALPFDMSVIKEDDWLYVDIGPSRLVRPLLIVDPDQQLAIDRLKLRGRTNQQAAFNNIKDGNANNMYGQCIQPNHVLLCSGAMEYISAWEQEYIKVATSVDVIRKRLEMIEDANDAFRVAVEQLEAVKRQEKIIIDIDGVKTELTLEEAQSRYNSANDVVEKLKSNRPYTHCELDPQAILGIAAALIPWPNHNQAPRNTYQVSMGKQALGVYHSNHVNRFDGKTKLLVFPNRPMVETEMYDVIGLDERGPGENVNIAFMAFPYTEEDSFVVKKEFLDNGGFRMYKYLTYKTIVKHSGDVTETLTIPPPRAGEPPDRYKYIQMAEPGNPMNGLPMIGAPLRQGDCVIGKIQHVPATKDVRNESVILRVGDEGVVDKVLVTSDNKTTVVIVKLRVMRIPQEGDKYAPRNAQKGTIGLVMSDIDMPVSEDGISPDIIVNPHSMPSRMTMAYPMELLAAKYGAYKGVHINGGAFQPFELNEYRAALRLRGKNEFGYEKMRSGTSGKLLQADIYSGPVFFQALKHHVKDKVQVRSTGQVKPMTRQPPKGRGNRGGLRFGEMERDAGISHGASSFLRERLMLVSDAYQTVFCKTCGTFAINDATTRRYKPCRLCGDDQNFGRCTIPYAYKLLVHLLAAPGINLRPEFVTSEEYADKIFRQRPIVTGGDINDIKVQLDEADEALDDELQEFADEGLETDFAEVYDY